MNLPFLVIANKADKIPFYFPDKIIEKLGIQDNIIERRFWIQKASALDNSGV